MLHENERANLEQTLERTRAALGVFGTMEGELRSIRKGMAPGAEKERVEEMVRLNRETLAALERKLAILERALAQRANDGPPQPPPPEASPPPGRRRRNQRGSLSILA